jgi:uncharacterized protein YndB with AHSA1/START domain
LAEIAITRVYGVPREEVWAAWTEPERLAQWWGKRGWTATSVDLDVRPGGAFGVTTVQDAGGAEMAQRFVYREVVAPERLVFGRPGEDAEAVVTFASLADGRTEMHFRTTIAPALRDTAAGGLASAFDRLADHLQSRPRSPA